MDKVEEIANLITRISRPDGEHLGEDVITKDICNYFDKIKLESQSQADIKFLYSLALKVGIPHYFDLLTKYTQIPEFNEIGLDTISAAIYENSLHTSRTTKLHKHQKHILKLFDMAKRCRFFLSASTSFGKTHLVFEIIRKMKYDNIILVFPTIALLSENLERLLSDENYEEFRSIYSIHTLSEPSGVSAKNIFIYTPERYLAYSDRNKDMPQFDFVFVDEVYKIEGEKILDQDEVVENERDITYRIAVKQLLENCKDVLLAGPYVENAIKATEEGGNNSFQAFLNKYEILYLDYNRIEIVGKLVRNIVSRTEFDQDDELDFQFPSRITKKEKIFESVLNHVINAKQNAIIYCPEKIDVERLAKRISKLEAFNGHDNSQYVEFLDHIKNRFKKEWSLIDCLAHGVGMHHGLIPKYIQKEIVSLFNRGYLPLLFSTTTITEGVNTSAKNIIVLEARKGSSPLKRFDAKNIAGRAGRFNQHYNGRVIAIQNNFIEILNAEPEGIEHKNFDANSGKGDVDVFISTDEYLSQDQRKRKGEIIEEQQKRGIPDSLMETYKGISRLDKISVYDEITRLDINQHVLIGQFAARIRQGGNIDFAGFQIIIGCFEKVVRNATLKGMIDRKVISRIDKAEYSLLSFLVYYYLKGGFMGSVDFKISQGKAIDTAIRETSAFVYNTLKYQLVKYLGIFNVMYQYFAQNNPIIKININGIELLLAKLEYNALTEKGRLASDYGVPTKVIDFFENESRARTIYGSFDNYEKAVLLRIETIIPNTAVPR